jgi:TPR repeat protein
VKNLFRNILMALAMSALLPMDGFADFLKGLEAYSTGDYVTALKEWKPLAERGDIQAQINLADIYYYGRGVSPDSKEAVKWLKSAAVLGDAKAAYMLGVIYKLGHGLPAVPKDRNEAAMWYQIAVNRGHKEALYDLGEMYYREGNYQQAAMLLPLSSNSGNASAAFIMGELFRKGLGVPHDNNLAAKWHRLALQRGLTKTQMRQLKMAAKESQSASNLLPSPNLSEQKVAPAQTTPVQKQTAQSKPEPAPEPAQEPTVVQEVASTPPKPDLPAPPGPFGSGFFVSKLGHVITTAQVIKGCISVSVVDSTNRQSKVEIFSMDRENGLVLLKLPLLKMAFSETTDLIRKLGTNLVPLAADGMLRAGELEPGEKVIFAGYRNADNSIGFSGEQARATGEMVGNKEKFLMDGVTPSGKNGGPIYDKYGNIVGVVFSQINNSKASGSEPENVSFGIKAATIHKFLTASGVSSKWSERSNVISNKQLRVIAEKQALRVMCAQ